MNTLDIIPELKEKLKNYNAEKEIISNDCFIKAKANLRTMFLENEEDAFLYFASLNVFNAYVKQNKGKVSYGFKNNVLSAFDALIMNGIPATYDYDKKEKLLIVNIKGMQFSFHNVLPSSKMEFVKNYRRTEHDYYKQQEWEGIRLQPIAESLFNFANNLKGLSNKSLAGDLKAYQQECIEIEKAKENENQI